MQHYIKRERSVRSDTNSVPITIAREIKHPRDCTITVPQYDLMDDSLDSPHHQPVLTMFDTQPQALIPFTTKMNEEALKDIQLAQIALDEAEIHRLRVIKTLSELDAKIAYWERECQKYNKRATLISSILDLSREPEYVNDPLPGMQDKLNDWNTINHSQHMTMVNTLNSLREKRNELFSLHNPVYRDPIDSSFTPASSTNSLHL